MRTQREVGRFVADYMAKAQLPVPLVVFHSKHPAMLASSDPLDYVIHIYGLPVTKTVIKHECPIWLSGYTSRQTERSKTSCGSPTEVGAKMFVIPFSLTWLVLPALAIAAGGLLLLVGV